MNSVILRVEPRLSHVAYRLTPTTTHLAHCLRSPRQQLSSRQYTTTSSDPTSRSRHCADPIETGNPPLRADVCGHSRRSSWRIQDGASHSISSDEGASIGQLNTASTYVPNLYQPLSTLKGRSFTDLAFYGDIGPDRRPEDIEGLFQETLARGIDGIHDVLRAADSFEILDLMKRLISCPPTHDGRALLSSLPATTFSEILRHLDPVTFTGRYINLFEEISPSNSVYEHLQSSREDGIYDFAATFLADLKNILAARRAGGHELGLTDFKHLLRCGRAIGDMDNVDLIWKTMLRQHLPLDVECYNHYLATLVWADSFKACHRRSLRNILANLVSRKFSKLPAGFGYRVGEGGVLQKASLRYNEMNQLGILGDEDTYCLMIMAYAREGNAKDVTALLKTVWGFNIDDLQEQDHPAGVKYHHPTSPLHPSQTLLMTLAHAYGINNEVPTALRAVDFVSRHYHLRISIEVWQELLKRTYVVARRFTWKQKDKGAAQGQLPRNAIENMWNIMVAEPYNIKPTMSMYDQLIMSLLQRERFRSAEAYMYEALQLHIKNVGTHARHRLELDYIKTVIAHPSRIAKLKRDVLFSYMTKHRDRQYIRQWVKQLIRRQSLSLRNVPSYFTNHLPTILESWLLFAPRKIQYRLATGCVSFHTQYERANVTRVRKMESIRDAQLKMRIQQQRLEWAQSGRAEPPYHTSTSGARPLSRRNRQTRKYDKQSKLGAMKRVRVRACFRSPSLGHRR